MWSQDLQKQISWTSQPRRQNFPNFIVTILTEEMAQIMHYKNSKCYKYISKKHLH